jgi:hypothetical protein
MNQHVLHEALVDLDLVERKTTQIAETNSRCRNRPWRS